MSGKEQHPSNDPTKDPEGSTAVTEDEFESRQEKRTTLLGDKARFPNVSEEAQDRLLSSWKYKEYYSVADKREALHDWLDQSSDNEVTEQFASSVVKRWVADIFEKDAEVMEEVDKLLSAT